ncbi:MAG: plasmid stabilization system protein [Rhodospirillales bacterium]|nr:plasmid stabilization system protein [Rhodospirillales bacterium]
MLPVFFTASARTEILEARDWYEAQQSHLAQQFDTDLEAVVLRISENPLQFRIVSNKVRRALLRQFPYGVFFRILTDRVHVIAYLHTRRDPRRW